MEREWYFTRWYTYYKRVFILIGHHVKYWWRCGSIFAVKFSKGLPFLSKDFETLYKCYKSIHTYKMGTFATWQKKQVLIPKYTNVLQGMCMNEWPIWTTKNVKKNPYEVYSNHYYINSVMWYH